MIASGETGDVVERAALVGDQLPGGWACLGVVGLVGDWAGPGVIAVLGGRVGRRDIAAFCDFGGDQVVVDEGFVPASGEQTFVARGVLTGCCGPVGGSDGYRAAFRMCLRRNRHRFPAARVRCLAAVSPAGTDCRPDVITGSGAAAAQPVGVAPGEAPCAVSRMGAAKFVACRRMVTRRGSVAHGGQFGGGEQLLLPHDSCLASKPRKPCRTVFQLCRYLPGSVTNVRVTPADGALDVTWSGPADTGTADVSSYVALAVSPDGSASACQASCTVEDLTNGVNYDVAVSLFTEGGASVSAVVPGLPTGRPSASPDPAASGGGVGGGQLPITGAAISLLILVGGALVMAGVMARRRFR